MLWWWMTVGDFVSNAMTKSNTMILIGQQKMSANYKRIFKNYLYFITQIKCNYVVWFSVYHFIELNVNIFTHLFTHPRHCIAVVLSRQSSSSTTGRLSSSTIQLRIHTTNHPKLIRAPTDGLPAPLVRVLALILDGQSIVIVNCARNLYTAQYIIIPDCTPLHLECLIRIPLHCVTRQTVHCSVFSTWQALNKRMNAIFILKLGVWVVNGGGYVAETEIQLMRFLYTPTMPSNYENWLQIAMITWRQHSHRDLDLTSACIACSLACWYVSGGGWMDGVAEWIIWGILYPLTRTKRSACESEVELRRRRLVLIPIFRA